MRPEGAEPPSIHRTRTLDPAHCAKGSTSAACVTRHSSLRWCRTSVGGGWTPTTASRERSIAWTRPARRHQDYSSARRGPWSSPGSSRRGQREARSGACRPSPSRHPRPRPAAAKPCPRFGMRRVSGRSSFPAGRCCHRRQCRYRRRLPEKDQPYARASSRQVQDRRPPPIWTTSSAVRALARTLRRWVRARAGRLTRAMLLSGKGGTP